VQLPEMCCPNTKWHALHNLHFSPNIVRMTEEQMLASMDIWIKEKGMKHFDTKSSRIIKSFEYLAGN